MSAATFRQLRFSSVVLFFVCDSQRDHYFTADRRDARRFRQAHNAKKPAEPAVIERRVAQVSSAEEGGSDE